MPEVRHWFALMKNCLTVAADQRDALGRNTEFAARGEGGLCKDFSQAKIQLAEFTGGDGALLGDAKNLLAQRVGKLARRVAKKLRAQLRRRTRYTRQGDVDTVGGRAGHEAENEHGFGCHCL